MKRNKSDHQIGIGIKRWRWSHALFALTGFYLIFIYVKFQTFMEVASLISSDDSLISLNGVGLDVRVQSTVKNSGNAGDSDGSLLGSVANVKEEDSSFHRKLEDSLYWKARSAQSSRLFPRSSNNGYGRISGAIMRTMNQTNGLSELEKMAVEAWTLGLKAWEEAVTLSSNDSAAAPVAEFNQTTLEGRSDSCPLFVSMNGEELRKAGNLMILPCGLAAGSSITLVGFPRSAHEEYVVLPGGVSMVWVSQFALELRGLKAVDGEDPPRILHVNPRLRGDWSKRPVIEHNTCYRMQWGTAQRCDGIQSTGEDDTVDGFVKCEQWVRDDAVDSKESKTTWWLKRFIGRAKKPAMTWPFPFKENRLFVLTVRAGVEGYHINVGGRHITSFPYRTGFALDDATGLSVTGDVDLHSMFATSLPLSHPSFSLQHVLEMSEQWRSPPLHGGPVYLCIGILSSANHFAERMAIRKSWMQSDDIRSSKVVARFFVALNARKHVNLLLKKEAEYFGDIIILPFIDRYELVVLKTIAICEYGVHNLSAAYIMKCDDDTFVRVDSVLKEVHGAALDRPLYMGNLNLLHKPLRGGKWAVTFEEWPEEVYPPYANGPGYVISSGIARYIASKHANHSLRLFKMEDVSMGLWVQEFNSSSMVQYSHSWKFCQYGCMDDYYTAHYQSPRQMMCLWDKLKRGKASCCNFR